MSMNCLKEALGYNLRYLLLDFISCPGLPNGANLDPPDLQILGAKKVTMQKITQFYRSLKNQSFILKRLAVQILHHSAALADTI